MLRNTQVGLRNILTTELHQQTYPQASNMNQLLRKVLPTLVMIRIRSKDIIHIRDNVSLAHHKVSNLLLKMVGIITELTRKANKGGCVHREIGKYLKFPTVGDGCTKLRKKETRKEKKSQHCMITSWQHSFSLTVSVIGESDEAKC